MMMIRPQKVSNAPPVPPRPSKTVVAEALAKSRKLSPVRVLYATQPLSSNDFVKENKIINNNNNNNNNVVTKPVVPVRVAPPPPIIKPRPIQAQIVKSFSSATVFSKPQNDIKISRSISDCGEEVSPNQRTIVYQSNNIKTSKIEVNLTKKNSFKTAPSKIENSKNEKNKEITENGFPDEKYCTSAEIKLSNTVVEVNSDNNNLVKDNTQIIQSHDKTMITVSSVDDDNNNKFKQNGIDSDNSTVLVIEDQPEMDQDKRNVKFDDKINHEILIAELENMRKEQERLAKRQRKPFKDIYDTDDEVNSRISHSDWVEVANGEEVRLSSCQIFINNEDEEFEDNNRSSVPFRTPRNMSLHGLPPLPKSLSGFNLLDNGHRDPRGYRVPASPGPQTPSRASSSRGPTPPTPGSGTTHVVYPPHPRVNGSTAPRKPTNLDMQLAILRREMVSLIILNACLYIVSQFLDNI